MALERDQRARYARHLLLSDIGPRGQERLLAAAVEVPAASGAGAPALLYLAAAGVGTLVVTDATVVDAADGFLYGPADVGRARVDVVRERLAALNPDVRVVTEGAATERMIADPCQSPFDALEAGARAAGRIVVRLARGATT